MDIKAGGFVLSKAGHDKGKAYLVLEVRGDRVLLSDGKAHPKEAPKKKNPLHLQPTSKGLASERFLKLKAGELSNEEIRRSIREWQDGAE